MLMHVIENTIPKIADQCANIVMQKIEPNIEKQCSDLNKLQEELNEIKKNYKQYRDSASSSLKQVKEQYKKQIIMLKENYESKQEILKNNIKDKLLKKKKILIKNFDLINEDLNEVKMEIDEEEKINCKFSNCADEQAANLILMKRQIDDKIDPVEVAFQTLNDRNVSESDLNFLKNLSTKFNFVYSEILDYKADNLKIKQDQNNTLMSMAMDDLNTNDVSFTSEKKEKNVNNQKSDRIRKITCYQRMKPF